MEGLTLLGASFLKTAEEKNWFGLSCGWCCCPVAYWPLLRPRPRRRRARTACVGTETRRSTLWLSPEGCSCSPKSSAIWSVHLADAWHLRLRQRATESTSKDTNFCGLPGRPCKCLVSRLLKAMSSTPP